MNLISLMATWKDWTNIISNAIDAFIGPLLIILCSLGIIYAVIVGIKMLKADSKEKRQENKQILINIAISLVAVIVLIAVFYGLRAYFEKDGSVEEKLPTIDMDSTGKTST